MAPEKCNYIIFSNNLKTGNNERLDLNFFNGKINKLDNDNPTFLGIIFDKHLNFNNQIENIKNKLTSRINILKTLSHKFWKINTNTLLKIYNSLIRSVIDYSLFLYPILSAQNQTYLQTTQNNCLRIIYRIHYDPDNLVSNTTLHKNANLETIAERACFINSRYKFQCLLNNNPIIVDLINDFEEFKNTFETKKERKSYKTLLGNYTKPRNETENLTQINNFLFL